MRGRWSLWPDSSLFHRGIREPFPDALSGAVAIGAPVVGSTVAALIWDGPSGIRGIRDRLGGQVPPAKKMSGPGWPEKAFTMRKTFLLSLVTTLLVCAFPAIAQDTGIISGRVQDTTGAVVAGAQITVTNTATNVEDHSQSNAEGNYRVPALRPGTYRVVIAASGFKRVVRENVELRVGAAVQVDGNLEVGAATDSVDVAAAAPLLDTETSSTGTVVEGNYFVRMPLFQSQAMANMYLTPGVLISGAGYSGGNSGFQINGESSGRMAYYEDGIYGVGAGTSYVTQTLFNTVDEVKVLTTVLPAEYGHSAGGAISVVKRSGTNQLHGRAGISGDYGGMYQRYFFQEYKLSQSQPGAPNGIFQLAYIPDGELDGPVYIPKIYDGRNKTFFMFGMKRYIQKEGLGTEDTIPTAGELQGNFSFPRGPGRHGYLPPIRSHDHYERKRRVGPQPVPGKHHPPEQVQPGRGEISGPESLGDAQLPRHLDLLGTQQQLRGDCREAVLL